MTKQGPVEAPSVSGETDTDLSEVRHCPALKTQTSQRQMEALRLHFQAPLTVALYVQGTVPNRKVLCFQLISAPPSALTATCSYPKMHEGDDTPISTSKRGEDR